ETDTAATVSGGRAQPATFAHTTEATHDEQAVLNLTSQNTTMIGLNNESTECNGVGCANTHYMVIGNDSSIQANVSEVTPEKLQKDVQHAIVTLVFKLGNKTVSSFFFNDNF